MQTFLSDQLATILIFAFLIAAATLVGAVWSLWHRFRTPQNARGPRWRPIAAFALVLFGAGGAFLSGAIYAKMGPSLRAQSHLVGESAPPLEYQRVVDGVSAKLTDHDGDVVLVNVWATWCGICRAEMPELDRLQREFGPRGLAVVTVSDEERSTIQEYFAENPMDTVNAFVESLPWHAITRPTSYVVDRSGTIRKVARGARTYEQLTGMIEPYL